MIPLALALSLAAAGLHATWNVLLKTAGDPLRTAARAVGAAVLVTFPVAALAWLLSGRPGLPPQAWLLAGLSGFAELAYLNFLSAAYRCGDLSVVYPLARGTAPLLAVPAGLAILRERLSPLQLVGVACLLAGIWAARRPVAAGPAVRPALLTGVCIATYSAIDRVGVRLAPPWLYGWVLWIDLAVLLAAWLWLGRRQAIPRHAGRPIDAPADFARGLPGFAISVGVLRAGAVFAGAVYDPIARWLFTGCAGRGAWLNERPLHVGGAVRPEGTLFSARTPFTAGMPEFVDEWMRRYQMRRFGSTALHLCYVALGGLDFVYDDRATVWDIAGAAAVIFEAGGLLTVDDGAPLFPMSAAQTAGAPIALLAGHPLAHAAALCRMQATRAVAAAR